MTGCAIGTFVRPPWLKPGPADLPDPLLLHETLRAAKRVCWQGLPLTMVLSATTAELVRDTLQALATSKP